MADPVARDPSELEGARDAYALLGTGDLLRLIAEKDRLALRCLYDRFGSKLLALLNLATGNPSLSDDLLVETVVAIWKTAPAFDENGHSPQGWLFAILCRVLKDRTGIPISRQTCRTDRPAGDFSPVTEHHQSSTSAAETIAEY